MERIKFFKGIKQSQVELEINQWFRVNHGRIEIISHALSVKKFDFSADEIIVSIIYKDK